MRLVQQLERHLAIQLRIVRRVDLAHAAATNEVQDHVASHGHAAGQRGRAAPRRQQPAERCAADVSARGRRDQLGTLGAVGEVLLGRGTGGGVEPAVGKRDDCVFVQAGHACERSLAHRVDQCVSVVPWGRLTCNIASWQRRLRAAARRFPIWPSTAERSRRT